MPKDWTKELDRLNFRCQVVTCRKTWAGKPDLVEPDEEAQHHPFRYFGNCPRCGAENQPQAAWERSLLLALLMTLTLIGVRYLMHMQRTASGPSPPAPGARQRVRYRYPRRLW
jgi:hypothetical protein